MAVMLPDEFIQQIKEDTNIIDLIGEYTDLKKAGDHVWKGRCTFPDRHARGDKDPSMTVYDNGSFYCQGCGAGAKEGDSLGSDVIAFIRMKEDLSFNEAVLRLASRLGIEAPEGAITKEIKERRRHLDLTLSQNRQYYSQLQKDDIARKYIEERGLADEEILQWRIGVVPPTAHFRPIINRIAFPIFDEQDRAVGFGFRTMYNEEPKYLNSPDSNIFKKGSMLYGLNFAKKEILAQRRAYVTEGYLDVISAHRVGVRNAVGIMGTSFTDDQARLLRRYTDEIIFALDGDTPGQSRTSKHIQKAKEYGFIIKVAKLEGGLDLDDYAKIKGSTLPAWLRENETAPYNWQIDNLMAKYHSELSTVRERAFRDANAIMETLDDPLEKAIVLHRISNELDIPALKVVHWWMNRSSNDLTNDVDLPLNPMV
jgi:DNA primase